MLEEKLNKIIESIELQNRHSPRMAEAISFVNLSLSDLTILAEVFHTALPEKIESFTNKLSIGLNDLNNPDLSINDKSRKETEIAELFENNKESLGYLNALNSILITDSYDPGLQDKLNLSYGFPPFKKHDNTQWNQYLEKLAESYIQRNDSDTVQYLVRTNNNIFLEHSEFVKDVRAAIRITEREQLKKKVQLLDKLDDFDLPESEIKAAVRQLDRERLLEMMRKADTELAPAVNLKTETLKTPGEIIPIEKHGFNWKRFAIAASVIGFIAITAVIVLNRKERPSLAGNKPGKVDTIKGIIPQQQNDMLASSGSDTIEMNLLVKKETALGFAEKKETMTIHIYRAKKNIPDSLAAVFRNLDKQYNFEGNKLSVYLSDDSVPGIYKIEKEYYMKIGHTVHRIRMSNKLSTPEKINDKDILERINKINFLQGN